MRRIPCFAFLAFVASSTLACSDAHEPAPASSPSAVSPKDAASFALQADSTAPVAVLWDATEDRPRRVHGAFASNELDHERAARAVLTRHATLLKLRPDTSDLKLSTTRTGLAGTYLRFQQVEPDPGSTASGTDSALPVFEAEVIVLVAQADGHLVVRDINLAHRSALAIDNPPADIGAAAALAAARTATGMPIEDSAPQIERGIGGDPARLGYRVRLSAIEPDAAWEVFVDAASGLALSVRDRIVRVTGTGMVFDPSPVATTGDTTLMDNGDATSAVLDAARYSVSLPNLDNSGYLRGLWVDSHTKNINQRAQSATFTFNYNRSEPGFEQTNAYYHIDRAQTRIQSLGLTNVNAKPQNVISDGQQGDNSWFDPQKLVINYGEGGVDDAEDADVVLHEYGHAIQEDQVPGFGSSVQAGSMGEGFGDYLATSFAAVLSQQIIDPNCLAEWDATFYDMGDPPCLRRTDSTKHYPEHAVGQIHTDGEMWSSALFSLDQIIGADTTNTIVIEAHFSQSTTETFFAASQSLLDTDANLFGGAHEAAIRRRLIQQGLCRILSAPSPLSNVLMPIAVSIDNPRVGGVYADLLDDTQSFTYPGAQALRLHFTAIDTELDPSCLNGACDNIYLTDNNGDLYQILSGQQNDALSTVIPGDTVHIRLVTDSNTPAMGYHVDRVDVMGDSTGTGGGGGMGGSGGTASGTGGGAGVGGAGASGAGVGGAGVGGAGVGGAGVGGAGVGGAGVGGAGVGGTGTGGAPTGTGGAGGNGATGPGGSGGGPAAGTGSATSTGSTASSTSGAGTGGSTGTSGNNPTESEGCGCRTAGAPLDRSPFSMLLGGALAAAFVSRRRRRPSEHDARRAIRRRSF